MKTLPLDQQLGSTKNITENVLCMHTYLNREFSAANRTYRLRMKIANDIEIVAYMMYRIYLRQKYLKMKQNDNRSRSPTK